MARIGFDLGASALQYITFTPTPRKLKGKMLSAGCEKMNVHSTELEGRIRKLDCCLIYRFNQG